jgi:hypothetical protein
MPCFSKEAQPFHHLHFQTTSFHAHHIPLIDVQFVIPRGGTTEESAAIFTYSHQSKTLLISKCGAKQPTIPVNLSLMATLAQARSQ